MDGVQNVMISTGWKDQSAAPSDYILAQHGIRGAMILEPPTAKVAGNTVTFPCNLPGFH